MEFADSDRVRDLKARVTAFVQAEVIPAEARYQAEKREAGPWDTPPVMEELKKKARAAGLWNLFLPDPHHGAGLTNVEYAPLCEIMGRVYWAPEVHHLRPLMT